ncbi:methylmalonyl-CoA mutase family protein [Roseivirga sp.]|uniref:methylmalonyl-CoA mutase family protein n=1 Tax=Roseivirga sp. TaxID=1964215 RepID=UPI002B26A79D|nr:methylmalonyl-CoA mutase family protein [Roseivirga sp.]
MEQRLFDDFKKPASTAWQNQIIKELKGKPIEELNWEIAGAEGKPFYTQEDLPSPLPQLQIPNHQSEAFGIRNWVNYQVIEVSSEKEANEKALLALNSGATGILFQLKTVPNFDLLLKDILIHYCHVSFKIEQEAQSLVSAYEAYVKAKGIDEKEVRGFLRSHEESFLSKLPNFRFFISEEKNDNVNLGLAVLLAKTIDLVDASTTTIEEVQAWFKRIQFNLNVGESYFLEITRHRALRILVGQLANSYGFELALNDIQIASSSGQWNEPTKDEYNYLLRATTEAMTAIIGGTNAVIIQPFHHLFPKNPAQGERIARNISTILKDESYLDKTLDPSAGSYYIESLTAQLVEKTWATLQQIEAKGGLKNLSENDINALAL